MRKETYDRMNRLAGQLLSCSPLRGNTNRRISDRTKVRSALNLFSLFHLIFIYIKLKTHLIHTLHAEREGSGFRNDTMQKIGLKTQRLCHQLENQNLRKLVLIESLIPNRLFYFSHIDILCLVLNANFAFGLA